MISKVSQTIYVYKTTLLYVKDGDTIQADIDLGFKMRWTADIRFFGIDTYERSGINAHPLGNVAKVFLEELFKKYGTTFYLHSMKDDVAIYNRVSGRPYLETTVKKKRAFLDVVATMKLNGFDKSGAIAYDPKRPPIYKIVEASDIDVIIKPVVS